MDYTNKIKELNSSILKIRKMLETQESISKEIRRELDFIMNKQLDFITDEQLDFITDEQLDFITDEQSGSMRGMVRYRVKERNIRVKELVKKARHTRNGILEILYKEFLEYQRSSHRTFLMNIMSSKNYKSRKFEKLVIEDPDTGILSFGVR